MAALVTLAEAKSHLRVLNSDQDTDIGMKAEAASDIVTDYIKRPDHEWTDADAPALIKAAILLVLGDLFNDREGAGLSEGVKAILHRYRDPALA